MRPLQGSLPDMTLPDIKKMFPAVLDMKNAKKIVFQNSAKDRMTHFNISVAVKRGRYKKRNIMNVVSV